MNFLIFILTTIISSSYTQKCITGISSDLANYNEQGIISPTSSSTLYTYKVLRQYPQNTSFYTQGLSIVRFNDEKVFLTSTGLISESGIGYTRIQTGEILKWQNNAPNVFGEGSVLYNDTIYQLTWQNCHGILYNRDLNKLGQFGYTMEGWGITKLDLDRLIISDGTDRLFVYNTTQFLEKNPVPMVLHVMDYGKGNPIGTTNAKLVKRLNEIENVNGYILSNIYETNYVVIIDPIQIKQEGQGIVKAWIDFSGLLNNVNYTTQETQNPVDVLNGIAWDEEDGRLYVTGKLWPRIFEVVVMDSRGNIVIGDGIRPNFNKNGNSSSVASRTTGTTTGGSTTSTMTNFLPIPSSKTSNSLKTFILSYISILFIL